jgi:hypothetical protein
MLIKPLTLIQFHPVARRKAPLALSLALFTLAMGPRASAQGPTITTFDALGAGTATGQGTFPTAISPAGSITGQYADASNVSHGFLRAPDGSITTFDAPGAGNGGGQGTIPVSNNPAGAITGNYVDASGVSHGLLRSP